MIKSAGLPVNENPIDALITSIRRDDLDPTLNETAYNYASLPLCVIDAVFSIGVRYGAVEATIKRFCERTSWRIRRAPTQTTGQHTISDFIALRAQRSADELASDLFGNRQKTSARNGIRKAEACFLFAEALKTAGIEDFCDMFDERQLIAEALILGLPGQSSGIAFDYFLILAGDTDMVKPDRQVQRYVAQAVFNDPDRRVSPRQAALLVKAAARRLRQTDKRWNARSLDHAIWRKQGGKVLGSTG